MAIGGNAGRCELGIGKDGEGLTLRGAAPAFGAWRKRGR
jgi:hypothetical protein